MYFATIEPASLGRTLGSIFILAMPWLALVLSFSGFNLYYRDLRVLMSFPITDNKQSEKIEGDVLHFADCEIIAGIDAPCAATLARYLRFVPTSVVGR